MDNDISYTLNEILKELQSQKDILWELQQFRQDVDKSFDYIGELLKELTRVTATKEPDC